MSISLATGEMCRRGAGEEKEEVKRRDVKRERYEEGAGEEERCAGKVDFRVNTTTTHLFSVILC